MPDILQTSDHYKHSRKWTLAGRWGEECMACLVFLLDGHRTPVTKKKSLLGEINHLLRTSDELKRMLHDCDFSRSLSKILISALALTQDDIGIESVLLLEQHIPCTVHSHSITILEEVCRRFYEQSNNPKVAGLLARTLSELITANLELRNEVIRNKLVDNMCDSLRPSGEQIQNVILTFLLHFHSYSPLHQVISELRLIKLVHNTIKLLSSTTTVAKSMFLIQNLLSNEAFANKHKTSIINQGKLMQGIKHALAYTKSSEVISSALALLKVLDSPQLITQHNLLDYILECLSSEDENVCITSLDLCISSQHNNKSSVMYISDSLIALIDREKKRMRGDIIERCLIFLIKLSEIRTPDNFHSILINLIEWGNETLVSLICLIVVKFSLPCTHVQAMKLVVELTKWLENNLSQRSRKLPTYTWIPDTTGYCRDGEQVLSAILQGVGYLVKILLDQLDQLQPSVLQDIIVLCDQHCIPAVFSLETSELCPHVYKHIFSTVTLVLKSCYRVYGDKILEDKERDRAANFATKIFKIAREAFILRSTLCSAYKHPDVLSTLHDFITTTTSISLSHVVPYTNPAFTHTLSTGLDVLPYTELEQALQDSLRSAERPSYHTDLGKQSSFCANVTCLALIVVKASSHSFYTSRESSSSLTTLDKISEQSKNQTFSALTQMINLYGTHRLLPEFFISLVVKLCSLLKISQTQGLKLSLETQEQLGRVNFQNSDFEMAKFVLSIEGLSESAARKCGLILVNHIKEGAVEKIADSMDPKICMKILSFLGEDGKVKEHLNVIQVLIRGCTDKKILGGIIAELNSTAMLDTARYKDSLTILTSVATCNTVPANTRTVLAVLQCVLCDSGNTNISLQYLYVQYVVNPAQMSDLMSNRYDVIACLCSQIKYTSGCVNEVLLLLLEHLKHHPDCEGVVVDLVNVVEIVEHCPNSLTLALLWKLLKRNCELQDCIGLKYLALRTLLEPDHSASLSAAVYIRSSDYGKLPWVNIALQTSLLLDFIPSGVVWLLGNLENKILRLTVQHRIKHLLCSLKCQFQSEQQSVVMKLLTRLFEIFPEFASSVISQCSPTDEVDPVVWHRQGDITFHKTTLDVIGVTKRGEIRKSYCEIFDYVQSNT